MTKADKAGDLAAIQPHIVTLIVKSPRDGSETGLEIDLRSATSPEVRSVQRHLTDRRLQLAQRNKNFTAEQLESGTYDQLVAATVGWRWNGIANFNGEKLEFNARNVKTVYEAMPWIVKQVDEKLAEDEDFFR